MKSIYEITEKGNQRRDKTTIYIPVWRQETGKVGRKKEMEEEGKGLREGEREGFAKELSVDMCMAKIK